MRLKYLPLPLAILMLTFALLGVKTAHANPDVKDRSINALVNYKTNCNIQSLTREITKDNALKVTAKCANETFYPDGLVVLCSERDVDMSCEIVTKAQEFKLLNLIYGPMSERVHGPEAEEE
ncbi:hypothetical protein ACMXYN_00450 [Neptuniibacter sp. PT8_73]|uniref:hypothetical protein n=1 Tax=Neptuniibacter sp. PT8_73 TaxID=3398206 RepID=UPI0039F4E42D